MFANACGACNQRKRSTHRLQLTTTAPLPPRPRDMRRRPPSRTGLGHSLELQVVTPTAGGGGSNPLAPGGKRQLGSDDKGHAAKRFKVRCRTHAVRLHCVLAHAS